MTSTALAAIIGASVALFVWSLRDVLGRRWKRDVAWIEHTIWKFTPEPFPARAWVAAYYTVAGTGLLTVIFIPYRFFAVIVLAILLAAPLLALRIAWSRRRTAIDEQLPASMHMMASGVASGLTLAQSIERLATSSPAPIRVEFRVMANLWRLGSDFEATIQEARRRLDLQDFNLFASAIIVNQRMGGDIVKTLTSLSVSLESNEKARKDVHAATAEGRMNVKVLCIAPFIMLGFVAMMDFGAFKLVFTKPIGHALLAVAAGLTAAGALWAWSIVHADV